MFILYMFVYIYVLMHPCEIIYLQNMSIYVCIIYMNTCIGIPCYFAISYI